MRYLKKALLLIAAIPLVLVVGFVLLYQYAAWSDGLSFRYMQWQCDKYGGEFIEQTVEGVEGFLLMRVRAPTHIYSELERGRVPEAPYGHTTFVALNPGGLFMGGSSKEARGYRYIELPNTDGRGNERILPRRLQRARGRPPLISEPYVRFLNRKDDGDFEVEGIATPTSVYGLSFEELPRSLMDRLNGVWRSEERVYDLRNDEILAVHRGFLFLGPWRNMYAFCPSRPSDFLYDFLAKVLKPI